MVLSGLVFEGLTQKNGALVVYLIPVFAIAHVQCGFNVAGAFLVTQMDLHTQKKLQNYTNIKRAINLRIALMSQREIYFHNLS